MVTTPAPTTGVKTLASTIPFRSSVPLVKVTPVPVDLPEYFQLASDSRPIFGPTLTLVPSATGTYVHVRYCARNRGPHIGQLTIQAPYSGTTVALEGRTLGMLPALRNGWIANGPLKLNSPIRTTAGNRWVIVLAVAVMSGLMYVGYTHRNQLLPNLFQNKSTQPSIRQETKSSLSQPMADGAVSSNLMNRQVPNSTKRSKNPIPATQSSSRRIQITPADRSDNQFSSGIRDKQQQQPIVTSRASRRETVRRVTDEQAAIPSHQQSNTSPAAEESELERMLNRPPGNQ